MVTVPNGIAPIVTQIEPKQAKFDQEIKVFGQNFTKTDNIISSHLGIIKTSRLLTKNLVVFNSTA